MRIGINGRAFNVEQPRGSVQAAMLLTKALQDHSEHHVRVFGRVERNSYDIVESFLDGSQVFGLGWEQIALPKSASNAQIDVLLCPNGNAPVRPVSVPTVVVMHSLNVFSGFASLPYELLQRYRLPKMLKNVDGIISVSEFLQSRIHSEFEVDTQSFVVGNGIHPSFFEPADNPPEETPDDYLLFVGAVDRRKNLRRVLEAYSQLRENRENPPALVVVGTEYKRLDQVPDVNLDAPGVIRLGFVSQETLVGLYAHAEALIFPSLLEWFGLPPVEAMAAGTPVIASRWPCFPEVLDDAAEFVSPIDVDDMVRGISQVLDDEEYATELVKRGHEKAGEFQWESVANEITDCLKEVRRQA